MEGAGVAASLYGSEFFVWYDGRMAKPLIVGNWKAYVNTLKDAKKLLVSIEKGLPKKLASDVVVCPPFPLLDALSRSYRGSRIAFGSQDVFYEAGAHTGEVTAPLVRDTKARYAIVGHAERRQKGDTDEIVSKKLGAALDNRLVPILCVGERARDKEGHYLSELTESLLASLALVDDSTLKKIVVAYEPVWAIGAPLPPSPRTIREALIFIRKTLASRFDRSIALKVRILYGGAVTKEMAPEILAESGASGFLLGRASVDAEEFTAIVPEKA